MIWTAARAANSEPEAGIVQLKKRGGRVLCSIASAEPWGGKKEGRFGGKIPKKSQLSLKTGGCSKGVVKPPGSNSAREHGLSTGSICTKVLQERRKYGSESNFVFRELSEIDTIHRRRSRGRRIEVEGQGNEKAGHASRENQRNIY
jgi:hypothetical protein